MLTSLLWTRLMPTKKLFILKYCEGICLQTWCNSCHSTNSQRTHTCLLERSSWSCQASCWTGCARTTSCPMLERNNNVNLFNNRFLWGSRTNLTRFLNILWTKKSHSCSMRPKWDTICSPAKISWSRRASGMLIWTCLSTISIIQTTSTCSRCSQWLCSSRCSSRCNSRCLLMVWWLPHVVRFYIKMASSSNSSIVKSLTAIKISECTQKANTDHKIFHLIWQAVHLTW